MPSFPVHNTKMKRGWDISFLNNIKIKRNMWVSYSFKAALDYSHLIDQCIFDFMIQL